MDGVFLACFARHPICLNNPLEQLLFHTSATPIFVKNGEIEKSAASIPKKHVERKPLAISRTVGLIDLLEVSVISWLNTAATSARLARFWVKLFCVRVLKTGDPQNHRFMVSYYD